MRTVAICSREVAACQPHNTSITTVSVDGLAVTIGLLASRDTSFDRLAPDTANSVLVRVRAFSCNYRDKALISLAATRDTAEPSYYAIGSEFVGEVLDVGTAVSGVRTGDRVIGNNAYPLADAQGVRPGVPTNHSSKELQVFHEAKLIAIPPGMTDAVAAGFSVGAQTGYSMIRKLQVTPGSHVLVTAAKSNTSLFAINALKQHDVNVYATTRSRQFASELGAMGVKELILMDSTAGDLAHNAQMSDLVSRIGGFDGVIDPFFDVHLGQVVGLMKCGARYVTCGLYAQGLVERQTDNGETMARIMTSVVCGNFQVIGNCLGVTDDLRRSIEDHEAGALPVVIDSVFRGDDVGAFLGRTFSAADRFGKVVYQYE